MGFACDKAGCKEIVYKGLSYLLNGSSCVHICELHEKAFWWALDAKGLIATVTAADRRLTRSMHNDQDGAFYKSEAAHASVMSDARAFVDKWLATPD